MPTCAHGEAVQVNVRSAAAVSGAAGEPAGAARLRAALIP